MATCVCAGDMCNCEAIQVPPKLPFWKKHDRRIHGFIAWMAVINMALLASMPLAMEAQEPSATNANVTKPSITSGIDACMQRCSEETKKCTTVSASGTVEQKHAMCETRAADCLSRCALAPELGLPPKEAKDSTSSKKLETRSASASEEARKNAQADKRVLETAKKRVAEFARNIASVKAKVAQVEKNGMQVSSSLKDAISQGEALVAKIKAAKSMSELGQPGEAQGAMEMIAGLLKQDLRSVEKQKAASQKFSALEKQMREFDHQLATAKKLVGDNAPLAQKIADVETALNALKTAYRQAHDMIVVGDVEDGFKILEKDMPGLMTAYKEALKALYSARAASRLGS